MIYGCKPAPISVLGRIPRLGTLVGASLGLCFGQAQAEQTSLQWVGCGISKKAYVTALAEAYERKTDVKIDLHGGGATKGIREVASIGADIGGSCRRKLRGVAEESDAELVPVAWDALVVITHPDNPVDDITLDRLRAVMLGQIDDWSLLGGDRAPIRLFVREGRISGVGHALRKLVFNDSELEFGAADERFPSSGPLEKAVETTPEASPLPVSAVPANETSRFCAWRARNRATKTYAAEITFCIGPCTWCTTNDRRRRTRSRSSFSSRTVTREWKSSRPTVPCPIWPPCT